MTLIPQESFKNLTSTKLDIDNWHYLTESLESVHKFNLPSLYKHANEFDSLRLCQNIKTTFEVFRPTLIGKEKEYALNNLEAMKHKFYNLRDSDKALSCAIIIDEIINEINKKNSGNKKSYFGINEPNRSAQKNVVEASKNTPLSYMKASPIAWRRPLETARSTPVKVEPRVSQNNHPKQRASINNDSAVASSNSIRAHHKKRRHKRGVEIDATNIFASGAQQQRKNLKHVPK